jgi:hypothetical protein
MSGCQCGGQGHGACATEFQYAVKLVCGGVDVKTPGAPAAFGQYWTAINIHNPEKCKQAHFRIKIAVADPLHAGPVSAYVGAALGPDEAFEIDCLYIKLLWPFLFSGQTAPNFVKGYVVIETDIELDVVAVYTGAAAADKPLTTFQTERVQPRCVPVCEDLVLPLHTGFAAWQGQAGPAVPVNAVGVWAPAPFGSAWVSQSSTDIGATTSLGVRHFELCFDLCSGFEVPAQFQIQVLADDSAQVSLNGPPVTNVGQVGSDTVGGLGFSTPTLFNVNPNLLRAGRNCLRVAVRNGPLPGGFGPTGFALAGLLHVVRGKCPCAPLPVAGTAPGHANVAKPTLFEQMAAASKVKPESK